MKAMANSTMMDITVTKRITLSESGKLKTKSNQDIERMTVKTRKAKLTIFYL